MNQEIILTNDFITKIFKFFFYRNGKVFRTLSYLIFIVLATLVYFIVFLTKISIIVNMFDTKEYSKGIYLILVLVVLLIISTWLIVSFTKLFNQTKANFIEDLQKTYQINSTEIIEIEKNVITSKNTQNNHMYVYNLTDITRSYVCNGIIILQFVDDNFIFIPYKKDIFNIEQIKKHKKFFLKTTKKED